MAAVNRALRREAVATGKVSGLLAAGVPPRLWIERLGGMAALSGRAFAAMVTPGLSWRREFLIQCVFVFKVSLIPAMVVNAAFGFSAAGVQGGTVLSAFGTIDRDAAFAPVAFLREFGVFLTGSVVAGTVGTTITAELGARKIREELDALAVMGVDAVRNMVVPRIVALATMLMVINIFGFVAGVFGSYVAAVGLYEGTTGAFIPQFLANTSFIDLWASEMKVLIFGVMIGVIASYKGLNVSGGAEGVGRAVNESVVGSLIAIFLISLVYTQLFLSLYPEVGVYR